MAEILIDLDLHCRICLKLGQTPEEMNDFFQPFSEEFILSEFLKDLIGFKVEEDLNLPHNICKACTSTIVDFNNLIVKCEENEVYLRNVADAGKHNVNRFVNSEDYQENDTATESKDVFDCPFVIDKIQDNICTKKELQVNKATELSRILDKEDISVEKCANKIFSETRNELVMESVKYSCNICEDTFLIKNGFAQHMMQKHTVHVCDNQYLQYVTKILVTVPKGLNDTIRTPQPVKNECKYCKQTFETNTKLKDHLNLHKNYICEYCGAAFLRKCYLSEHIATHSTVKPYICNMCGKALKHRHGLLAHKRTHFEYKPHICETCGMSFREKSTLNTHVRLKHSDERSFSCSKCDLTFKIKSARDMHFFRKHTKDRPKNFICPTCGIAYLNKTTLTRHISEKHSVDLEKPSICTCNICDKNFSGKCNLQRHYRNVHKIVQCSDNYELTQIAQRRHVDIDSRYSECLKDVQ